MSGLVSVVLTLRKARDWGAGAPRTIALLAVGVALLAVGVALLLAFVAVEHRWRTRSSVWVRRARTRG